MQKVLQSNRILAGVGFSDLPFTPKDLEAICGAIHARNSGEHFIKSLGMTTCFEDGINSQTLKTILTSITSGSAEGARLFLNDHGLSSREAGVIAEFLNSNPPFYQLNFKGNRFDDADAALLANALPNNTHLGHISVGNNEIKENGRLAFLRAVFDVSSLPSCAASNHTCNIGGLERDISVLNSYASASVNKWSKIFAMLALSGEDSFIDTSLLRDVPVQLIPVILHKCNYGLMDDYHELTDLYLELTHTTRCQKHDVWDNLGEKKSLNCIYDLMRSSVVPSIFV